MKSATRSKSIWLETVRYSLKTAFKSFRHEKLINLLTILSVSVGLTIVCAFVMINSNMNSLLERWSKSFGVIVYLNDNVTAEQETRLSKHFAQDRQVEEVTYISKEQALSEIRETLGSNALILDSFSDNPLPASFELKFTGESLDPAFIQQKVQSFSQLSGVHEVQYGEQFLSSLNTISRALRIGAIIFGSAIFIAITFITYSTIKIFLHRRRAEIETLKMLGASRIFIRLPFLIEGIIIGSLSGAISALAISGLYTFTIFKVVEFLPAVAFLITSLPVQAYVVITCAGAMMSLAGSFVAVGKIRY